MSSIFNLLATVSEGTGEIANAAYEQFRGIVNVVLPVIMAFLLLVGMFYGIQLGVKYARAEEDDDKKKAKTSLINVIVGVLIAIVFIAVIQIILNSGIIKNLFGTGLISTDVAGSTN